jgi:hypothetical protein
MKKEKAILIKYIDAYNGVCKGGSFNGMYIYDYQFDSVKRDLQKEFNLKIKEVRK